jgi:hypothetical protein
MDKRLKPSLTILRVIFLSGWITVFLNVGIAAQDVPFVATAEPNVLRVGEQFTIRYESNQKIADIELPAFNEFQYLGGPAWGRARKLSHHRERRTPKPPIPILITSGLSKKENSPLPLPQPASKTKVCNPMP